MSLENPNDQNQNEAEHTEPEVDYSHVDPATGFEHDDADQVNQQASDQQDDNDPADDQQDDQSGSEQSDNADADASDAKPSPSYLNRTVTSNVIQGEPAGSVDPLPAPVGVDGTQPVSAINKPGLSPAAHGNNFVTINADSNTPQRDEDAPLPAPANLPSVIETGVTPSELDNPDAVQCPICQHRFVP